MTQSAQDKAYENRVRRFATRQRYTLVKSRVRDHRAWAYGRYWLAAHDPDDRELDAVVGARNNVVGAPPGMTLNEIERFLASNA